MGLYLAVFASDATDDELDGVEVGSYDDFNRFREAVHRRFETGSWGSLFPTLLGHSDADGVWTAAEAADLLVEVEAISRDVDFATEFVDVDGVPLVSRLADLARLSSARGQNVWFQ